MATKYLLKSNWNLEQAVSDYYSGGASTTVSGNLKASLGAVTAIFDKYKDPQTEIILIDGTLSYLEDLGIDPEDCLSLTLSYILNSPQTGEFHRKDFVDYWTQAGVSSLTEMKEHLQNTHKQLIASPETFVKLYNYVFGFVKGPDRQLKMIDAQDAISYWRLLFAQCDFLTSCSKRFEQWYTFVEQSGRGITKDLWEMFFKFLVDVLSTDPVHLSSYDEMSAWHSMMDEYVEWLEDNNLLEASA